MASSVTLNNYLNLRGRPHVVQVAIAAMGSHDSGVGRSSAIAAIVDNKVALYEAGCSPIRDQGDHEP